MRVVYAILGVVVLVVLLRMSAFTVDPTEFVYLTQFGAPVATYDGGARDSDAGLHFRWPWPIQSLQRLDRRLQQFDLPSTELLTHDAEGKGVDQTLTVDAYVCWRILGKDDDPDAVDRFVRRVGTPEQAQIILDKHIRGQLGALVAGMPLNDLVSTDTLPSGERRVDATMDRLRSRLVTDLQVWARREYGVEVVDIRLRRINYPLQVREAIFNRIRSERDRKAEAHRSDGDKQARDIRSAAEQKRRELLAKARATERTLKSEAETEADLIRSRAYSQDPKFYAFLKQLDKMQSILGENKTLLLLSTRRPIFDLLFQPPLPDAPGGTPPNNKSGPVPMNGAQRGKGGQ
jgi:membrane protease subunit HflC